jgi:hypothetical protein
MPVTNSKCDKVIMSLVYSGYFSIKDDGTIWRKDKRAERLLRTGYLQIRVLYNGIRYHSCSHRIIYRWFKGKIPINYEVNHIDGVKSNNNPSNLEVCSRSDNAKHAFKLGLKNQNGEKNPSCKLLDSDIDMIISLYETGNYTQQEIASKFNVAHQHISKIVKGKRRNMDKRHQPSEKDYRNRSNTKTDTQGKFTNKR